jgi:hypothetical protein
MTFSEINHALASGDAETIAAAILAIEALAPDLAECWAEWIERNDPLPSAWHEASNAQP